MIEYKGYRIQKADSRYYIHYEHITVSFSTIEEAKANIDQTLKEPK